MAAMFWFRLILPSLSSLAKYFATVSRSISRTVAISSLVIPTTPAMVSTSRRWNSVGLKRGRPTFLPVFFLAGVFFRGAAFFAVRFLAGAGAFFAGVPRLLALFLLAGAFLVAGAFLAVAFLLKGCNFDNLGAATVDRFAGVFFFVRAAFFFNVAIFL